MPRLSLYQTLRTPLRPRTEAWVRRILGAGQAILAILAGARLVTLTSFLHRAHATAPRPGTFAYGFAALTRCSTLFLDTDVTGSAQAQSTAPSNTSR